MIQFSQSLSVLKTRRRLGVIVTSGINGLLLPMLNPLVAVLVIRLASVDLWGKFVNLMIVIQLGTHIVNWGNKEFLLRTFSRTPGQIVTAWQGSLFARAWILVGLAVLLPIWIHTPIQWACAVAWATGLAWFQSLDVFIQYRRDFSFALVVDLVTLGSLLGGVFVFNQQLSVETLLFLFAGTSLFKAVILTYRYREYTLQNNGSLKPDFTLLSAALPFFLLGFSGMLQSRIDLYSVSLYFTDAQVGQYQVLINFILYLQAIANFILIPFVKNMYRMDYISIRKIAQKLLVFGLLITPLAMVTVNFVLKEVYQIEFSVGYFFVGGLYVLPSYYFLPVIYALFKAERQNTVLVMNFIGSGVMLGLNLIFLPTIGLLGAVVSAALVHWGLFLAYTRFMRQLA